MATISDYRRPSTLDEALELLARAGAVVLAGGTEVNATSSVGPVQVVDLQALGLDGIEALKAEAMRIGATTTLQAVVDDERVPSSVREAARREAPSTLRAAATLGGCVVTADPESELIAALLVHDATVRVVGPHGTREPTLDAFLEDAGVLEGSIVASVTIDTGGVTSFARTGRTRADRAIVSAFARRAPDGRRRLALSGVARRPVLVGGPDDLQAVDPIGDFRGSREYRRALAATLAARAWGGL